MRLPKLRYAISAGATLGMVIPLILEGLFELLHVFILPVRFWFFIWPSFNMLVGEDVFGLQFYAILLRSIAWNVLLYAIVFTLLWSLAWVLRAWRASLRDGTTI